jgi:[ribosomal protein S5]-alanine N-acetyltransferase
MNDAHALLEGGTIRLRLVRDTDLAEMYAFHHDISNRGDYFPVGVRSWPTFQAAYHESGFWSEKSGMLIISNAEGATLGHIEFFETVNYLDEIELSYILYSRAHDGRGIATEAVNLLSGYLFDRKKINRIRLIIHPDNRASKRVAEKTGYTFEGLARGAWFHRGRNHDVEVWSLLRDEHYARAR